MQLFLLFSALMSVVILATASPTPGAMAKRSSKREELGMNFFQRDDSEEGKKREELESNTIIYAWYDGPGGGDDVEVEGGLYICHLSIYVSNLLHQVPIISAESLRRTWWSITSMMFDQH
ncbi:hypothetical protein DFH29DRAFT_129903 [Suillus ampliporus]|nr:hypothetical protein DFH29DRAFT_129903 [Suillus ampliporus]